MERDLNWILRGKKLKCKDLADWSLRENINTEMRNYPE